MIKAFEKRHAIAAAEIEKLCFSDPWSEKAFLDSLENPFSHFLVFEEDDVSGYIGLYALSGEGSITNVAVRPEKRGLGIGEALVKEAVKLGEKMSLEFITLEVRESNTSARRLYEKCGFSEVGIRRGFYSKPKEDAVIMNYYFNKD